MVHDQAWRDTGHARDGSHGAGSNPLSAEQSQCGIPYPGLRGQIQIQNRYGTHKQDTKRLFNQGSDKLGRVSRRACPACLRCDPSRILSPVTVWLTDVLLAIPAEVAALITRRLEIPLIGIGAGAHTDGQVFVFNDLLGIFDAFKPKFVKRYAELRPVMDDALGRYVSDVRGRRFPTDAESRACALYRAGSAAPAGRVSRRGSRCAAGRAER
jgi:hypothetical protein